MGRSACPPRRKSPPAYRIVRSSHVPRTEIKYYVKNHSHWVNLLKDSDSGSFETRLVIETRLREVVSKPSIFLIASAADFRSRQIKQPTIRHHFATLVAAALAFLATSLSPPTDPHMSSVRAVNYVLRASETIEGAGFTVRRPFPTGQLQQYDPFLLLDHLPYKVVTPGSPVAGAPTHPHRGFVTLTHILHGEVGLWSFLWVLMLMTWRIGHHSP